MLPISRPTLPLDERTYERRDGAWFDTRTHLRASGSIGARLDVLAREQTAFWESCIARDRADRPDRYNRRKNSGAPTTMVEFRHGGHTLVMKQDVSDGWRRERYSSNGAWIWSCSRNFTWRDGWLGRVELWLWSLPRSSDPGFTGPRSSRFARLIDDGFGCELANRRLLVELRLLADDKNLDKALDWSSKGEVHQTSRTCRLFDRDRLDEYRNGTLEANLSGVTAPEPEGLFQEEFEVKLRVTLKPDPHREPGVYWEHCPLPSAGLPSLGKRRRH